MSQEPLGENDYAGPSRPGDGESASMVHASDIFSAIPDRMSDELKVVMPSMEEMVRRRLKVLSDLQSALDKMRRLVPNGMKLAFDVEPSSSEYLAPEPATPCFRTFSTWLTNQTHYLGDELTPIGDHDMDQQHLAVLRRLKSEIDHLQGMKETAWARLLATHIIRSHMSGADEKGPLSIERGTLGSKHNTI